MFLGLYTAMQTWMFGVRERFTREDGAVATEYALIITLVAIAIIAALGFLGKAIATRFGDATSALNK